MDYHEIEVLNFGSLNIDHVYQVQHFVQPKETLASSEYDCYAGGKGLNQSVALARAGVKVAHAGKIGQEGLFLEKTLQEAGVNTGFIIHGNTPTGHAIIQVDTAGQNCILLYPGANHSITKEEIRAILDKQFSETWLLLQNEINDIPFILREARKRGLRIAVNPAPCTPEVSLYPLEVADILFVNEVEAVQLAGVNAPHEEVLRVLTSHYPDCEIIMTLGGDGALFGKGDKAFHIPAPAVKVVDTTSAGDTFTGYYLAAKLRGFSPEKAMETASTAASISVSRAGAAVSIPQAEEVFSL